jgi:hypothetical protein
VHVVSVAGPRAVADAALAAIPILPVLALLETAAAALEARAAWLLGGGGRRSVLRGAIAAYASAQLLPGGRALGEALRAAHVAADVGAPRAAMTGLLAQGLSVALVPFVAALGLVVLPFEPVLAALLASALVWNAGLAAVLLLVAPRSPRLVRWLAPHAAASADVAAPRPESIARATAALVLARALRFAQAALVALTLASGGARAAVGVEILQLLAATAGDAVPGQAGVLEATFAAFSGVISERTAAVLAIPLVLRAARLALLLPAAAIYGASRTPVRA